MIWFLVAALGVAVIVAIDRGAWAAVFLIAVEAAFWIILAVRESRVSPSRDGQKSP